MYGISREITREFITNRISEKEIFERYVCPVEFGMLITSPLRQDDSPTCSFYYDSKDRLILKDFSGHFYGDCFSAMQMLYNIPFQKCLNIAARDFNILGDIYKVDSELILPKPTLDVKFKESFIIEVERKKWSEEDIIFWKSFGLNSKILAKYDVASIKTAWLNDNVVYHYKKEDPCYVYYFGKGKYKLYFPLREKYRFIQNTQVLQGYHQLPQTFDFLVITKSLKDVMVFNLLGVPAIAPAAESVVISPSEFNELSRRFKNIYSNYDFDKAGRRSAFKMYREYGVPCLFLTDGSFGTKDYQEKDISDYIKRFGFTAAKELVMDVYNKII